MAASDIVIDWTKPRDKRPMTGFDIEQWRGQNNLSKYEAQFALGFRNSNHYNKMCQEQVLPVATELIIRLYDEYPFARGWTKFTLPELFDLMYSKAMLPFRGSHLETFAKVDLGSRFCKLFGRSPGRHYQWLGSSATKNEQDLSAYSDVETILSKLKQIDNPGEVLERIAAKVWSYRGVDLDAEWPIPTLNNPPKREKTGRKGRTPEELALLKQQKEEARRAKAEERSKTASPKAAKKSASGGRKAPVAKKKVSLAPRVATKRAGSKAKKVPAHSSPKRSRSRQHGELKHGR